MIIVSHSTLTTLCGSLKWPDNVTPFFHLAVIKALQLISDVVWFLLMVLSSPENENLNFLDKTARLGEDPLYYSFSQYLQNSRAMSLMNVKFRSIWPVALCLERFDAPRNS